jgi:Predicted glycosyltransferases
MPSWNAAIVVHEPDLAWLAEVLASASASASFAHGIVIDNSERPAAATPTLIERYPRFRYRANPAGNEGFARAHNRAFAELPTAEFHAVLNPDVAFSPATIQALQDACAADADIVLAAPSLWHPDGRRQYLCKRYPSLRALFGRRFAGPLYRPLGFDRDDAFFTMQDCDYEQPMELEFVSGAFMWFRHTAFARLGGFDERYFMYLEDCDITLRARRLGKVIYVPQAKVVHHWARGNHHSLKLTLVAIRSAILLFNSHGWRWRDPRLS